MDMPCDYHSPEDPRLPRANHTNRQCSWHKRALRGGEGGNKKKGDNNDNGLDPDRDGQGGDSSSGGGRIGSNANMNKTFPPNVNTSRIKEGEAPSSASSASSTYTAH